MAGPGESGNGNSFCPSPLLHPCRENERQPMSRDRGVEECDAKPGDGYGGENRLVHMRARTFFRQLMLLPTN